MPKEKVLIVDDEARILRLVRSNLEPQGYKVLTAMDGESALTAAEMNDPDGWPSFWELAKMPHPHIEHTTGDVLTDSTVVTARPTAIGWHPPEDTETASETRGVTEVWDVTSRFGAGTEPKVVRG